MAVQFVPFSRAGKPLAVNQLVTLTGTITNLNSAVDQTTQVSVQLQYSGSTVNVNPLDVSAAVKNAVTYGSGGTQPNPKLPFASGGHALAVGMFVTLSGKITAVSGSDQTGSVNVQLTNSGNTLSSVSPLDIAANSGTL
jgi:hypothetical protein